MANPNPSPATRFKSPTELTTIGNVRAKLTWTALQACSEDDAVEWMAQVLREMKGDGKNKMKALELFAKVCFTMPKVEITTEEKQTLFERLGLNGLTQASTQ